jgi:hypothetical protein
VANNFFAVGRVNLSRVHATGTLPRAPGTPGDVRQRCRMQVILESSGAGALGIDVSARSKRRG